MKESESDNESIVESESYSAIDTDSEADVRYSEAEADVRYTDSETESDAESETVYAKHTYKSNNIGILSVQPVYYHKENKDAVEADIRIFCALCGTICYNEELQAYCPCKRIWIHPSCTARCVRIYRGVSYAVPIQCPYCFTK